MKKYVVEEKPLQAVLDYLATKPYKETVTLIANIQSGNKPFDETKIYSQVDLDFAKLTSYEEGYDKGLGMGFEQASNKTLEIKNIAEAKEEIKRLNLEAFSDA